MFIFCLFEWVIGRISIKRVFIFLSKSHFFFSSAPTNSVHVILLISIECCFFMNLTNLYTTKGVNTKGKIIIKK